MKLRLKEKELPPVQLRLVVPAVLKARLDRYVMFVREKSGREVEVREVAVEMLAQFMEADREFKRRQKVGQEPGAAAAFGGRGERGAGERAGVGLSTRLE
jgi:hypothetical protein